MRQLSFEEQQKLDSLAAAYDEQVDSGRQLVQRIGQPLDADFDERVYLGTGTAPPTGSFASDTFTDTDGTAITAHTDEVGATWTAAGTGSTDFVIVSNRLRNGGTSAAASRRAARPTPAEYDVAADFRRFAGGENYPGLIGRQAAGATNTRHTAFYNGTGWQLSKEVGGAWTSLGTVNFGSQTDPTPPRALCPRTPEAPH